jgi:predicted amidohydrolase
MDSNAVESSIFEHTLSTRVGVIQANSTDDLHLNLQFLEQQLAELSKQRVSMVFTPENMLLFANTTAYQEAAEELNRGSIQNRLSELAKRYKLWLHIGSFPIKQSSSKLSTTSLLYNPSGELVSHYNKLHLFDVDVGDAHQRYRESDTYQAGHEVVTCETPAGRLGITICYDVRFPALYQSLRESGANVIVVAAAFTQVTGKAHWETLLQSRAIETQSWIIASAQCGTHSDSRNTYGHSMVIDPWGTIAERLTDTAGHFVVSIDHQKTDEVRQAMPLLNHARFHTNLKE